MAQEMIKLSNVRSLTGLSTQEVAKEEKKSVNAVLEEDVTEVKPLEHCWKMGDGDRTIRRRSRATMLGLNNVQGKLDYGSNFYACDYIASRLDFMSDVDCRITTMVKLFNKPTNGSGDEGQVTFNKMKKMVDEQEDEMTRDSFP